MVDIADVVVNWYVSADGIRNASNVCDIVFFCLFVFVLPATKRKKKMFFFLISYFTFRPNLYFCVLIASVVQIK